MRLCSIASGSSGNCIYIGSDTTHFLVDVGISGKRTEAGLNSLGLSCKDLDGIFITHEHADHIGGLGVICRKYGIPIYATRNTINAILDNRCIGEVDPSLFHEIKADEKYCVKDMSISPMHVSHDAADPVAYRFGYGKQKAAICTDLGHFTDYTVESLRGMNAVLLEANHDVRMLEVGPYPYYLKQRILGDRGHLSNENSGKLLSRILNDQMQHIFLGHLSHENNLPELAYETVRVEVTLSDTPYKADDFPMHVASRHERSECVEIKG